MVRSDTGRILTCGDTAPRTLAGRATPIDDTGNPGRQS
jgi:hypothetical protein